MASCWPLPAIGNRVTLTNPRLAAPVPPGNHRESAMVFGVRRRPGSRHKALDKRPRTPQLIGQSHISGPRRWLSEWQYKSTVAFRRILPPRWRANTEADILVLRDTSSDSSDRSSSDSSGSRRQSGSPATIRLRNRTVTITTGGTVRSNSAAVTAAVAAVSAPAAAAMGVDLPTYRMLMDLQHRDITPEDFETLRQLDKAIKPKTVSKVQLNKYAPVFCMAGGVGMQSCCICIEELAKGQAVRKLTCGHIFHVKCVDQWLLECSDMCGECGTPVVSEKPGK